MKKCRGQRFFVPLAAGIAVVFCCWMLPQGLLAAGDVTCKKVDVRDWTEVSKAWHGRELVAVASWCGSCKEKLLSTKAAPEGFVFLSVFEEPEQTGRALRRLGLTSPCVYGSDLAAKFAVGALPWSKKI